jgi:hypothetical protein
MRETYAYVWDRVLTDFELKHLDRLTLSVGYDQASLLMGGRRVPTAAPSAATGVKK